MISGYKTTKEVAQQLGIGHNSVTSICCRHPHIRPRTKLPSGDLMWTDQDVERLKRLREGFRRGKGANNQLAQEGPR